MYHNRTDFRCKNLAYVVLILPSYSIVLTDLKLNFLAAMNVSFQYSACDILLPFSFLFSYQPTCSFTLFNSYQKPVSPNFEHKHIKSIDSWLVLWQAL
jgi:hypothetical protein